MSSTLNDEEHDDVYVKGDTTAIEMMVARAALQAHAESMLGRLLFAYSRLESALDLCLVWVDEGRQLRQRTAKIERLYFSGKLVMLAEDAHRSTLDGAACVYDAWLADAQTVRQRRNVLAHGRLCIHSSRKGLTVALSRATSAKQKIVYFSVKDLERLIAEIEGLIDALNALRTSHPL